MFDDKKDEFLLIKNSKEQKNHQVDRCRLRKM